MLPNLLTSFSAWAFPPSTPVLPTPVPPTPVAPANPAPLILDPEHTPQETNLPLTDESRAWLDLQLRRNPKPYGHVKKQWAKHCKVSVYRINKFIQGRKRQARELAVAPANGPNVEEAPVPPITESSTTDPDPVIVSIDFEEDSD